MIKEQTISETKTVALAAVVVQRLVRGFPGAAMKWGWIIWLNVMLAVMGYGITTWQWWATSIPVVILQGISDLYSCEHRDQQPAPMKTATGAAAPATGKPSPKGAGLLHRAGMHWRGSKQSAAIAA